MEIGVILNAHGKTELVSDTVDALRTYVSKDILMVVDGAAWDSWGKSVNLPVYKLNGFYHNHPKAPYRNLTYGLQQALEMWPANDWYCYTEYDVLFVSDDFKKNLKKAAEEKVWCIGNDYREGDFKFPYLESILNIKLERSCYLLGCCVFYHGDFLRKLKSIDFFNRFLGMTNDFEQGFFPGYEEQMGYDFGEHLYPTLANYYGGQVRQFGKWHHFFEDWVGDRKMRMRWKPELSWDECMGNQSILHPVKENIDVRWFYQAKRSRKKKYVVHS